MNINLQTINFKESQHLKDFVQDKVSKLFKLSPEIIRVELTLKEGAKNNTSNKWCSMYVSHPGENQFVKRRSDSYESSILQAIETMIKQLQKKKTHQMSKRNDNTFEH